MGEQLRGIEVAGFRLIILVTAVAGPGVLAGVRHNWPPPSDWLQLVDWLDNSSHTEL